MSTGIDKLVKQGQLLNWSPELPPGKLPKRRLLITKDFSSWAQNLPEEFEGKNRLLAPKVELETIVADFVSGARVISFIRSVNPPAGEGILKVHTSSFRLFGWPYAHQSLVLALGANVHATHGKGQPVKKLAKQAVTIRKKLGITEWTKGQLHELFRFED